MRLQMIVDDVVKNELMFHVALIVGKMELQSRGFFNRKDALFYGESLVTEFSNQGVKIEHAGLYTPINIYGQKAYYDY